MKFKNPLAAILALFFLTGTSSPTFAMWGPANDDGIEQARQARIQQQLEELKPLGTRVRDNMLHFSLKENNQVQLALALATSSELLDHYDVELYYQAPLSRDHLPLLRRFKKFASLMFCNQTLDITRGTILSEILSQHSTLTKLDFSTPNNIKLTHEGLIASQQSMSALPCIKILNLSEQEGLCNSGIETLSNILSNFISLEELNLTRMNLGLQEERQISNALSKLTCLKKINFSYNRLVGDFFASLKPLLNLTEVNACENQITGKKLRALPKSKFKECLKILNISNNQVDDEGLTYISLLPNLKCLSISRNNITDEGVMELTDLQNLSDLSIFKNKLSSSGYISLAHNTSIKQIQTLYGYSNDYHRALRNDPTLMELTLYNMKLEEEEVIALAKNTVLKKLSLQSNNIGYVGAEALSRNTTLTELNLISNYIGDTGAQALAHNTTLTQLWLQYNNIGDTGAQAFLKNTTLKQLNLAQNNITNVGGQALKRYGPLVSHDNLLKQDKCHTQ